MNEEELYEVDESTIWDSPSLKLRGGEYQQTKRLDYWLLTEWIPGNFRSDRKLHGAILKLASIFTVLFLFGAALAMGQSSEIELLTENTTPVGTDLLHIIDDPGGTPLSQKITLATFWGAIQLDIDSLSSPADDSVIVGDSASASTWRTVPDCHTNNMLTYTQSTNTFGCDSDDGAGGGAPVGVQYVVGATDATLTAEKVLTAGTAVDVTFAGGDGGTATVDVDTTEVNDTTFGDNSDPTIQHTYDPTGTGNPVWSYTDGVANLSTGTLQAGGTAVSTGSHFSPTPGIDTDHGAGAIDATTDFNATLCGTAEYLVDDGASWSCDPVVTNDGVGYDEVMEEGAGLTKRAQVNFIGSSVTCADNPGATRTDCTVTDNVGVASAADGTGIDGTAGEGGTYTPTLDTTEVNDITFGDNTDVSLTHTVDPTGTTNPVWTYTDGVANLSTGTLQAGGTAVSTGSHFSPNPSPSTDHSSFNSEVDGRIGATVTGSAADDQMLIGSGASAATWSALPAGGTDGCSGASDKPIYTASTNSWSCGTDGGGAPGTDSIGTDELDDGADTATLGHLVAVDSASTALFEYLAPSSELTSDGDTLSITPGADHIDALTEVAQGIKTAANDTDDLAVWNGALPGANVCVEMNSSGQLVAAADTCANLGPGGGSGAYTADGDTQITPTTSVLLDHATNNEIAHSIPMTVNKAAGDATAINVAITDTASPGLLNLINASIDSTDGYRVTECVETACSGFETLWGDPSNELKNYAQGTSLMMQAGDGNRLQLTSTGSALQSFTTGEFRIELAAPSDTNPVFNPASDDTDTGLGRLSADVFTPIAGASPVYNGYEGQLGSAAGDVVLELFDVATAPTSNPAVAGDLFLYADGNSVWIRNSSGTTTDLGAGLSTVTDPDMATDDFGDWSCGAGVEDCLLDAGVVVGGTGGEISDGTVDGEDMNANYAGSHLVETAGTPDTIGVEPSVTTHTKTVSIPSATTADDGLVRFVLDGDSTTTITKFWCHTDANTCTVNLEERAETTPNTAGTDVASADVVCDTNSQTATLSNTGIDLNDPLAVMISACGAVGVVNIYVRYTVDE